MHTNTLVLCVHHYVYTYLFFLIRLPNRGTMTSAGAFGRCSASLLDGKTRKGHVFFAWDPGTVSGDHNTCKKKVS